MANTFNIVVTVSFTEESNPASFTGDVVAKISEVPGVTNVVVSQITTQ